MTTAMVFHQVEDGDVWARAWRKGAGSRHEMFGKLGITARTFRDPGNPDSTGLLLEVPDMAAFKAFLETEEGRAAMREDGLEVSSLRLLTEFTP
jgi:hypothetical protein